MATISIVSHGQGDLVEGLLSDLGRQTIADRLVVIVTLNIPERPPASRSHSGLQVTVRRNARPQGFGANHNAALKGATTPWVVVLNPDVRIEDDTLLERLIAHQEGRQVGLVAPVIRNSQGTREDSVRQNLDPVSLIKRRLRSGPETTELSFVTSGFSWVAGMFLALRRHAWEAIGGFDERFFLYCEDYDLCARLALRGEEMVVDGTLEVTHDARRSSHTSFRYLRWHVASLLRVWTSPQFWRIWASDIGLSPRIPTIRLEIDNRIVAPRAQEGRDV